MVSKTSKTSFFHVFFFWGQDTKIRQKKKHKNLAVMKLQSFWQGSKNRVNILEEFSYVA